MMTRNRWNDRYRDLSVESANPAPVLAWHMHLLPNRGRALDIAAGLGANSVLLARAGLEVEAWDLSDVAMDKLTAYARGNSLDVRPRVCDVVAAPPAPRSFDVIVVSRFLERSLAAALTAALRPKGLLFYQTFTRERVSEGGPRTPDFRLAPNELLELFAGLRLVLYREEGGIGDTSAGFRDEAMLIAQRDVGV